MRDFNIRKAKLIIWDLDETFWQGILTESKEIQFNTKIINFIEELTTKGIMNSICSKNDYEQVKSTFLNNGFQKTWDYFLFPSISWQPKGERVKNIIQKMNLREENVIFIDDDKTNIQEVKFYCPNIMTAYENQIEILMDELYTVNSYDFEHKRLAQYKILEQKTLIRETNFVSNEDFLRSSGIEISFSNDCEQNIDRLLEMINRTNQLNFTKKRIDKKVLADDLNNPNYSSAYITVKDNYGIYGICGFYTLDNSKNELIHFLFSCRIMSMGIEQFVYSKLNKPHINIVEKVSSDLNSMDVDWIKVIKKIDLNLQKQKNDQMFDDINILFKGPCDLLSTLDYINPNCNIDTEFPYWNKQLVYILSHTHTAFIEQAHSKTPEELARICKTFPFPSPEEFQTKFFNKKYNIIFLSLLTVTHSGLYINKNTGDYVVYGYANCDITDENNWAKTLQNIPESQKEQNLLLLKAFKNEYQFAGNPPTDTVIKNLKYIRENLNSETELVLILGSEIPTDKVQAGYEDMAPRHKQLNKMVKDFAKDYNNISTIDITDCVNDENDYTVCINHFTREVYLKLAKSITAVANTKLNKNCLELKLQA